MSKKKRPAQTNKDDTANLSTIKTEDYQFLLSLEESRKATIYSRVSTIITCASLLWATAIIIPKLFADNAISSGKTLFQIADNNYLFGFIFDLSGIVSQCNFRKTSNIS